MRRIRLGMVGGGSGAFIGAVHRAAARLDDGYELLAGALSSDPDRARASAAELGLDPDRAYGSFDEMFEREAALPEAERIEAVSIVTPNHVHFPAALAALRAGFHVICDKPLTPTEREAAELGSAARDVRRVFAVTYNYSGYPLVKEARRLVHAGALGDVRKVIVEYHQGWLASRIEETGQKQASWRTDPELAGPGGAVGDIGSHAEQLCSYVTGLPIESLSAELTSFVPGRRLDDDASILLRFAGGARGVCTVSQVAVGRENDLSIRVFGTTGGLAWRQEAPNQLHLFDADNTETVLRRGSPTLGPEAQAATRVPPGHPEAFFEAFANIYGGARQAVLRAAGELDETTLDYPTLEDGVRGVRFITRAVESARAGAAWVDW